MMIFLGSLALFLVVFFFAACNVAHRADEYAKNDENAIKRMMCQDAQEICDKDCDKCAWGEGDIK